MGGGEAKTKTSRERFGLERIQSISTAYRTSAVHLKHKQSSPKFATDTCTQLKPTVSTTVKLEMYIHNNSYEQKEIRTM